MSKQSFSLNENLLSDQKNFLAKIQIYSDFTQMITMVNTFIHYSCNTDNDSLQNESLIKKCNSSIKGGTHREIFFSENYGF